LSKLKDLCVGHSFSSLDIISRLYYDGFQKEKLSIFMTLSIKFYTKPKCSLCDEVRILLNRLRKEYPLEVEELNILDDPDLYQRYKYEIPVLSFPDLSQLQGKIDRKQLKEKLDQVFKSPHPPFVKVG
jgi:thiol-disulfide isomerase/thioredoxin